MRSLLKFLKCFYFDPWWLPLLWAIRKAEAVKALQLWTPIAQDTSRFTLAPLLLF